MPFEYHATLAIMMFVLVVAPLLLLWIDYKERKQRGERFWTNTK